MARNKWIYRLTVMLGLVAFSAVIAFSSSGGGATISPDEAIQKLMEGNRRYVDNKSSSALRSDASARASLAKSQKPYAIILSCSDSRVPPEIIFDKGLGELFVVRVAGNIPDPIVLGSIEYAAEHLGSPLIMVLGHERCGAVKATVDAKGKSSGSENIDAIVKVISPHVASALHTCDACKGERDCEATKKEGLTECVIDINVKSVADSLSKQSKILNHLAHENKIKIVAAKYDLDDGAVTLFK